MKKLPLYLSIALIFLYSCKKSNSGSGTPSSEYYLSSTVVSVLGERFVDSFYYDTLHRINTFIQSMYDTPTVGSPYVSTWSVQFIYQGSNTWPSTYNFYPLYHRYGGSHLLSYDADDRMIKDTCLNGTGVANYFSYPNNSIVITGVNGGPPSTSFANTFFISNGNVSCVAPYAPPIPPDSLGVLNLTYSSVANPAFHPLISNSIGPLLTQLSLGSGGIPDFISKNALQEDNPPVALSQLNLSNNYALDTDNKGRLVKMTLISSSIFNTILFNYY